VIDLTSPTTCFSTTGFSFNGTVYTSVSLESNGRITFGNGDSDYSPTLTEALNGDPFIGFWTDLTPPTQPYVVTNPALGVLRVDIVAGYYPVATGLSFAIEIDDINQQFSIDGLLGITAQAGTAGGGDDQFLGLSVGLAGGATDPGATTTFTVGGSGATAVGTDMLYDFLDTTIIPGTGLTPSLSPGTLNSVTFFYQGASSTAGAGFAWTGS